MSETPEEKREAARTRRRWITLAEFVAVAGLLIAAATLWLNWSDRRADEAEKAAEQASESKARGIVTLTGDVNSDGDSIRLTDPDHAFSAARVRFPTALKLPVHDAMPGPRIHVRWFDAPILKLTDNGKDEREGRLPVLITVEWWDGPTRRSDTALYDILWRTEGRLLGGRKLVLTGLTLKNRTASVGALDAAWGREMPRGS